MGLIPSRGEVIGPESSVGNACGMYLDEVVRSLYKLGSQQLTDDMLDLSALSAYYVRGYSVADVGPLRRMASSRCAAPISSTCRSTTGRSMRACVAVILIGSSTLMT